MACGGTLRMECLWIWNYCQVETGLKKAMWGRQPSQNLRGIFWGLNNNRLCLKTRCLMCRVQCFLKIIIGCLFLASLETVAQCSIMSSVRIHLNMSTKESLACNSSGKFFQAGIYVPSSFFPTGSPKIIEKPMKNNAISSSIIDNSKKFIEYSQTLIWISFNFFLHHKKGENGETDLNCTRWWRPNIMQYNCRGRIFFACQFCWRNINSARRESRFSYWIYPRTGFANLFVTVFFWILDIIYGMLCNKDSEVFQLHGKGAQTVLLFCTVLSTIYCIYILYHCLSI